ncbi:uncharacterized protein V6R79_017479 [Siganus canaliculatus]
MNVLCQRRGREEYRCNVKDCRDHEEGGGTRRRYLDDDDDSLCLAPRQVRIRKLAEKRLPAEGRDERKAAGRGVLQGRDHEEPQTSEGRDPLQWRYEKHAAVIKASTWMIPSVSYLWASRGKLRSLRPST